MLLSAQTSFENAFLFLIYLKSFLSAITRVGVFCLLLNFPPNLLASYTPCSAFGSVIVTSGVAPELMFPLVYVFLCHYTLVQ